MEVGVFTTGVRERASRAAGPWSARAAALLLAAAVVAPPAGTPGAAAAAAGSVSAADRDGDHVDDRLETTLSARAGNHDTPVIVTFERRPDAALLGDLDDRVGDDLEVGRRYRNLPAIATTLDDREIAAAAHDPDVARIEADLAVRPADVDVSPSGLVPAGPISIERGTDGTTTGHAAGTGSAYAPGTGTSSGATGSTGGGATGTNGAATGTGGADGEAAPSAGLPIGAADDHGPVESDPALVPARSALGLDGDAAGDGARVYSAGDSVVAVIDSGIDVRHVDLDGNKVLTWRDFTTRSPTCQARPATDRPFDDIGHGTHVASTIAGDGDGNARYQGVAPAAALVDLKVFDCRSSTSMSVVNAALDWAITNRVAYGIDVINMSLGASGWRLDGTDSTSRLVNRAVAAGITVVVAAGNSGPSAGWIGAPGVARYALTVGATRVGRSGEGLAWFSSRGPTGHGGVKPDVAAPGVEITAAAYSSNFASAGSLQAYAGMSGTSMATPFTAGVAALALEASPSLAPSGSACPPDDLVGDCADGVYDATMATPLADLARSSTDDWGAPGPDPEHGYGRLRAGPMLASAAGASPDLPAYPSSASRAGRLSTTGDADLWPIEADGRGPLSFTVTLPVADFFYGPHAELSVFDADGTPHPVELACWGSSSGAYVSRRCTDNRTSGRATSLAVTANPTGRMLVRVRSVGGATDYRLDVHGAAGVAAAATGVVVEVAGSLTEGDTAPTTARVRLERSPTTDVTVRLRTDERSRVTPDVLTFSPGDATPWRDVSVTIVDDAVGERGYATTLTAVVDGGPLSMAAFTRVSIPVTDDDAMTGPVTRRLSLGPNGRQSLSGPESYYYGATPVLSRDGRRIAFVTRAFDLGVPDSNGFPDVYLRDIETGTNLRASARSDGGEINASSELLGLSDDGSRVLFRVYPGGDNTVPGDTNRDFDIFVRDVVAGTTRRVNLRADGSQMPKGCANSTCFTTVLGAISGDGRRVVFVTPVPMTPDDNDALPDAYIRDLEANTTVRVSLDSAGRSGTGGTAGVSAVSLSRDGRYLAFASDLDGLGAGERPGLADVFRRDLVTGDTRLASIDANGAASPYAPWSATLAMSPDGGFVAWNTRDDALLTDVLVRDMAAGTTVSAARRPDGSATIADHQVTSLTDGGRHVAFRTRATDLLPGGNPMWATLRRDVRTGQLDALTLSWRGTALPDAIAVLSPDGEWAAFASDALDVVSGDTNDAWDVFLRGPLSGLPSPPAGLSATPSEGGVDLAWQPVEGAAAYLVELDGATVGTVTETAATLTASQGLPESGDVRVGVRTVSGSRVSDAATIMVTLVPTSTPAPAPLAAPTGLAGRDWAGRATLRWNPVAEATGYRVRVDGARTYEVAGTAWTSPVTLGAGTHRYEVVAFDSERASGPAVLDLLTLARPAGLRATPGSGQVRIAWRAVPGATGYLVARSGRPTIRVNATSYTFGDLRRGQHSWFAVWAVTSTSRSAGSAIAARAR